MDIERQATSTINSVLSYNPYVKSEIFEGDKAPLQDGYICVYNDKGNNRSELKEVRVQVKGKVVKGDKFEAKYSIHRDYLEYFLKYGGIFFVVFIDKDRRQSHIYYKSLTQSECKVILDSMKNEQKTKSIEFKEFPNDEIEQWKLMKAIEYNSRKQGNAIDDRAFYIKDIQGKVDPAFFDLTATIHLSGKEYSQSEMMRELSKSYTHLYFKPKGLGIPFVIEPTTNRRVAYGSELKIMIEDKIYFKDARFIYKEGKEFLQITDNILIPYRVDYNLEGTNIINSDERVTTTISFDDDLYKRKNELEFILELSDKKMFLLNKVKFPCDLTLEQKQYEDFREMYNGLTQVIDVFQQYDINKSLSIEKLTDKDFRYLYMVKKGKVYKSEVTFPNGSHPPLALYLFRIGDMKILTMMVLDVDKEYYSILNVNNPKVKLMTSNKECISSLLGIKMDYFEADNLFTKNNLETIKKDYIKNDEVNGIYNNFLLEVIKYYDNEEKVDKELTVFMKEFAKFLYKVNIKEIGHLNYLQVKKRLSELNDDDMKILETYSNHSNDEIKFGALVLLNKDEKAKEIFKLFSKELQEYYKELPIYNLLN